MRIIYFDVETTGLDCLKDKIIELGMYVYEDCELIKEYGEFIDIGESVPKKITQLTGITTKMIKEKGVDALVVANILYDELNHDDVLMVAHNAQFDLCFVYHLLCKFYDKFDVDNVVSNVDWLDTLTILRDRKSFPHKLSDFVSYYNLGDMNFHRAMDDAKVLVDGLLALRDERNDLKEYVNVFGYFPQYGVYGDHFPFITYKAQAYTNGLCDADDILPYCNPLRRY